MPHPFPHSMALLHDILENPPPLVPGAALASARATYERFLRIPPTSPMEAEDALIAYGRVLWPYRKAFAVLVRSAFTGAEEHDAFAGGLSPTLRERFHAFVHAGGTLADLSDADTQRARASFSPRELGDLCPALVTTRQRVERAVRTAIAADATAYRKLVREFQAIQHELEQHLSALRRLADRAVDYPVVAAEIRETVRSFERGLAQLAREPAVAEVCATVETYRERDAERHGVPRSDARERIFGSR